MPAVLESGPTAAELEAFDRDGYVVIRGLFDPSEAAEIRAAFMRQADAGPVPEMFDGVLNPKVHDPLARYPRMMHPHRQPQLEVGQISMRYMLDKRIEKCLSALIGDEAAAAQSMFYFKPAGARGQALHQDNFYLRVSPGTCYAAWMAVDDADEENGTLMVVPGSDRLDIKCPTQADTSVSFTSEFVAPPEGLAPVPLNLKAGDCLFFNGSVIHGSYPNSSEDRFRCAFICHYIPVTSAEAAHWYSPMLKFDGSVLGEIAHASGGGPCGTDTMAIAGPH